MYFNKTDTCVFCLKTAFCLILLSNHGDQSSLLLTSTETETIQTDIRVLFIPCVFFHCTTVLHVSPILPLFLELQEAETVKLQVVLAGTVLLLVLWSEKERIYTHKNMRRLLMPIMFCNGNSLCGVVLFYTQDVNIVKQLEYLWTWKTLLNY